MDKDELEGQASASAMNSSAATSTADATTSEIDPMATTVYRPTTSQSAAPAEPAQKRPEPTPLSPSQRFRIYNNNIKDGIRNGIKFTQHLDQLTETTSTDELLVAATALFSFTMDTDFVTFPHQYSAADYYLLFMGRLLELHDQTGLSLTSAADHEELSMSLAALGDKPAFKFVLVGGHNGGAFFTDRASGLHLFYLNLERQQLRFNSKAFVDLFAVTLNDQVAADRMAGINALITFAKDLEHDYDFSVDYNLLEATNGTQYKTKHAILPAGTVDRLFVASADSHYMLQNAPEGNGAVIELEDGLVFGIVNAGSVTEPRWVMTTTDPDNNVSLMNVLLHYKFICQWYLDNRADLEIQSDPLIFA
ncbi:hypothetical protein ACRYI5_08805 [Furfurilactobacillus sp. WILCCON 0119]